MRKIPTLFVRDGRFQITPEVTKGCEWVLDGLGVATEKFDGSACLIRDRILYKRYDCKPGRIPPETFIEAAPPDKELKHHYGWIPVTTSGEDKYHQEAYRHWLEGKIQTDGTYELVGPKVQGNPYQLIVHKLYRHGDVTMKIDKKFLSFDGLKEYLSDKPIEGVVWWWSSPNGLLHMAKIKRRDYGFEWPIRREKPDVS